MKQGYIQCRDGVYWSENRRPVTVLPISSGKIISLNDEIRAFTGMAAVAFCCMDCKKIIIDF
jgi:hypothetical protein